MQPQPDNPLVWVQGVEQGQELNLPQPEETFGVQHFTAADGLPDNSVWAILEDHLGFHPDSQKPHYRYTVISYVLIFESGNFVVINP